MKGLKKDNLDETYILKINTAQCTRYPIFNFAFKNIKNLIVLCPKELIPIFLDLDMIVIQFRDRLNVLA